MVDDFKSIRENLFKVLKGISVSPGSGGEEEADLGAEDDAEASFGRSARIDASTAKALLGALFARAGKGKDEVVQIVAREIGLAVAAMLKEPLSLLAKHQKLQISFEFVPKAGHKGKGYGEASDEADEDAAEDAPEADEPRRGGQRTRPKTEARSARPKRSVAARRADKPS